MGTDSYNDAFSSFMLAQSERETAYERYNYAAAALVNAHIKERLAKIKSQHEPLSSLMKAALSERDRLYAAAYYVVVGRMPDGIESTREDTNATRP